MRANKEERGNDASPIVAIGASAGGLEALTAFFSALPDTPGAAFVVVMHLAPEHHSELAAILGRQTRMPVTEVSGHVPLERDHVYVIPPDRRLELTEDVLNARPFEHAAERRASVDLLFRSLAQHRGNGFAVILSGGGSDGAVGVKAVKEEGGVILVQDPAEAGFDGMPRAAIATGIADLVLPARELAMRLCDLIQGRETIQRRLAVPEALEADEQAALGRIIGYLNARTGHDFSHYKRSTVLRRVARRMQVHGLATLDQYLAFLKDNADEAQSLFQDMLISVTTFFRDTTAWDALRRQVIPRLFDDASPDDPLRAWVPGCATGEEAYSLAMLLLEEAARRTRSREVELFASDLDERGLSVAREGRYPLAVEADVSAERLGRFFVRDDDHYRVGRELRDAVLFARHNLLRDPPFARQDLISCRNLLIYLDREVQEKVFGILRYALRPGGYLFLGVSEHAEGNYFRVLDKPNHIYQARAITGTTLPLLPEMLSGMPPRHSPSVEQLRAERKPPALPVLHRALLEEQAPPSILVDDQRRAIHLSERAGRYLQPPPGPLVQDVTLLVRQELRAELSAALYAALERGEPSLSAFVPVQFNGTPRRVAVLVQPRAPRDGQECLVLVLFLEAGELGSTDAGGEETGEASVALVRRLKEELASTRTRLRTAREEFEATNEELRAANEELQSLNEEYRSTAEELETSKEELQSINEELQTVNSELKNKLEEVLRARNDLENLMVATEIPTLFLDRALCIKRFTPQLANLFSIKASDLERPVRDLNRSIRYAELEADAARVLDELTPMEREVSTDDGRWYLIRLRPYRTPDDRIEGVVITFVDFTEQKHAEEERERLLAEVEAERDRIAALVASMQDEVWFADMQKRFTFVNPAALREFALSADETAGVEKLAASLVVLRPDGSPRPVAETPSLRALEGETVVDQEEIVCIPSSGERRDRQVNATPVRDKAGRIIGSVAVVRDITARKQAEAELERIQTLLAESQKIAHLGSFEYVAATRTTVWSEEEYRIYGLDPAGPSPTYDMLLERCIHPDDASLLHETFTEAMQSRSVYELEHRIVRPDGSVRWVYNRAHPYFDEQGELVRYVGATLDVTERHEADQQKSHFLALLGHELRNPLAAISSIVDVLRMGGASEDHLRQSVAVIDRQVRHLVRLVDDLLSLSRISRGQMKLRTVPMDARESIRDAVAQARPVNEAGDARLDLDLPGEPLPVEGDRERLTQILTNLLVNAYRYTGKGGTVTLSAELAGDRVLVRVRDTGIGIAAEDLPRLFEPFTRLESARRRDGSGLGLGLALARQLATLHGGTLEARSDGPGRGSEFTLGLPLLSGDSIRPVDTAPAAPSAGTPRRRVLVAEDDPAVGEALVMLLESLGQDVRLVPRGGEVEATVEAFRPSLLILDLGLPDIGGHEIARRLRESHGPQALRIVALTGYSKDALEPSDLAGFDRYLMKPATLEQLKTLLREG
jgi:two-component system CheB/CheR fusion protein